MPKLVAFLQSNARGDAESLLFNHATLLERVFLSKLASSCAQPAIDRFFSLPPSLVTSGVPAAAAPCALAS